MTAESYRTWHSSVLEAARLLRRIFPEADLSALLGMDFEAERAR